MLELIEIKENEKGQVQECFKTNNSRIKQVNITYTGNDEFLDGFLKSVIINYAKKQKMID